MIRWLTENRNGANRRVIVETDKVIYKPGEEIHVKARAYDEKLLETDRYRIASRIRPPTENESRPFDPGSSTSFPNSQRRSTWENSQFPRITGWSKIPVRHFTSSYSM